MNDYHSTLVYIDKRFALSGLDMLKIQGLNDNIVLVVVQEKLPKSDAIFSYRLILDYKLLNWDLYETVFKKGYYTSLKVC